MLRDQIGDEMRAAMKARDPVTVGALRLLMTAIKNAQVERGHELSDEEVIEVASKEAKKRRESVEAFEKANRPDLVSKEMAELRVIEAYLPAALTDSELALIVDETIAEVGAATPKEIGAVMKGVMPKVLGRADGTRVSALVKQRLGA